MRRPAPASNTVGTRVSHGRPTSANAIQAPREFAFTETDYQFLASFLQEKAGISLRGGKSELVYSRISQRLRDLGLKDFKAYCAILEDPVRGEAETGACINALTTNLTKFFREDHHFAHLRDNVLKPLKASSDRRLRLWSAGCSTGEEPYSIAMTVQAAIPDLKNWDARILATDLDTKVLAEAAAGRYAEDRLEGLSDAQRDRHFERVLSPVDAPGAGGIWRVRERIKSLIAFKQLNLIGPWPMKGPFDAIFCRNVMIYFDRETCRALVEGFANLLRPRGWLYLGHSEGLHGISTRFSRQDRTTFRLIT